MNRSALPLVLRRVGAGQEVAQPQRLPGLAEQVAAVADAVVGHDPAHGDALAGEPDHGPGQEAGAGVAGLVVQHLDIGGPGMVVDADVDVLEADLAVLADPAAGDAVPRLVEAGEPLDVEMDQIAGAAPLVAPDRRLGLEGRELAEAKAGQLRRDRRAGEPEPARDLGRGQPAVPQPEDHLAPARAHPTRGVERPRGAVDQARGTFGPLAGAPFAHRADADAEAPSPLRPRSSRLGGGRPEGLDCTGWSAHSDGRSSGFP